MPVINVKDDQDFKNQLSLAGPKPIIVDFTAVWCGPCKMIAPAFEALSNQYLGAIFLKVDVDVCEETTANHGVTSMPTFMVFLNGLVSIFGNINCIISMFPETRWRR